MSANQNDSPEILKQLSPGKKREIDHFFRTGELPAAGQEWQPMVEHLDVTDYPEEDRRAIARHLREYAIRLDAADREDPERGYGNRAAILERLADEVDPGAEVSDG